MRAYKILVPCIAMVLLLAGCSIYVTNAIYDDGSGELSIIYKLPASYSCKDAEDNRLIPSGFSAVQDTAGDGDTLCKASRSFQSVNELHRILENMDIVSIHALGARNGQFFYDIDVFPRSQDAGFYDMAWAIQIPGKLNRHNASSLRDSGVMVWRLNIDKRNHIYAESELPVPPTAVPTVAQARAAAPMQESTATTSAPRGMGMGCVGLLVVVASASVFFFKRTTRKAKTSANSFAPGTSTQANQAPHLERAMNEASQSSSAEERLRKLQNLRDKGLIDEQEYVSQKSKILGSL